ncbi:hypothetical protein AMS68_001929 [Peltaster fructicola]|uniref:mRNA export factor MEX67 n=1 Tax=Peltaster fructicola TaxID=286661 RepID=A0A6H0XNS5_9PEZI|nr:hypothetical protein AMS68_001929 [Peltaster fructicola]
MVSRGSTRQAPKGPAATRARLRKDKDGDLTMGVAVKGRGGIGKTAGRGGRAAAAQSAGKLAPSAQKAIMKHIGAGDITMREAKRIAPRGLVELKVGGWAKSKASTNPDGGVSSLISWLEKKASNKLGSRVRSVKVKKSHTDGDDLIISVAAEDMGAFLRVNGWVWAGTNVTVQRIGGEGESTSTQTAELKDMIKGVLDRRYNLDEKLLDLSALGQDPDLQAKAVFNQKSTTSKFFPAMMKILQDAFDTANDKDEAILSVSLANNDLSDLTFVTTLSATLPKLRNLDLSNNKFDNTEKLSRWRRRFAHLGHIIVSGNPLEQNEPDFVKTLSNWYPRLLMVNNIQVRTAEDVAKGFQVTDIPFPIRSAIFQDEGGIAENFIRTFFAGFDTDRNALVGLYYDAHSTFSVAINTAAPRDPAQPETTEKQEWDAYIKHSRNLRKITQVPARANRLLKGQAAIAEVFAAMPQSKHPDLAAENKKWMIEAHIQPGVPDALNSSANGVDGFMIVVHGEYDEIVLAKKKRSFDRTFILGPGGPHGVRIVSDVLNVRAYGGSQAFEPDNETQNVGGNESGPQLPDGLTVEIAQQMVIELQKQTMMTQSYAQDCLEQSAWNFDTALKTFQAVKATLPPDAFVQAV